MPPLPSAGGITPPSFNAGGGAGGLPLSALISAMMIGPRLGMQSQAQLAREQAQTGSAVGMARNVASQFGGRVPPGTQMSYGDVSIPLNRKYTLDEAKSISSADAFSHHLSYIRNAMSDPDFKGTFQRATFRIGSASQKGEVFGIPTTFGDAKSAALAFHLKDLENRLLYMRSGAQINEREYDRLSRALPSFSDVADPRDTNFTVLNQKLDNYEFEMQRVKDRVRMGGQYDDRYWNGPVPDEVGQIGNMLKQRTGLSSMFGGR